MKSTRFAWSDLPRAGLGQALARPILRPARPLPSLGRGQVGGQPSGTDENTPQTHTLETPMKPFRALATAGLTLALLGSAGATATASPPPTSGGRLGPPPPPLRRPGRAWAMG